MAEVSSSVVMASHNGGTKVEWADMSGKGDYPNNDGQALVDPSLELKRKLDKLQSDTVSLMDEKLSEMFQEIVSKLRTSDVSQDKTNQLLYDKMKYENRVKTAKDGNLPDKQFLARESLLTYLFEIQHFRTIYNIFIAILIILFLNTAVYDLVTGEFNLGVSLIYWNFGGIQQVFMIWLGMMAAVVAVYPCFSYWVHQRIKFSPKSHMRRCWDCGWLVCYIAYQTLLGIVPVTLLLKFDFPPASSMMLLMEQVRLIMKSHAFVRSNIPRALSYKPHSDVDVKACPDFGWFMYFLFVPTLVYRDSYPRTKEIRWKFVAWHFMEVIGVIFYTSFIFERFLMPVFYDYGIKHFTPQKLVVSIFGSMMPATLAFLCGFFCLLHSWMNAFAELTRFADRMFYKDWWNANSYAAYYRMWNVVVHDWLYTYIYKDCCLLLKSSSRLGPTLLVFIVSALVHEYILMFVFRFFYPMLFLAFGGFSAILVFLISDSSKLGNLFMWLTLCTGTGLLTSVYCMEWYARVNCPRTIDSVWDFFVPRSWFCNVGK